jgi:putative copper export protein/mono/diheme cytochrome c family protein
VITASGIIRFFHLTSTALLFGSFAFYCLVSRPALTRAGELAAPEYAAFDRRQRRFARWMLLAVFLTGLFSFWLQVMTVSGSSMLAALHPAAMADVLLGTRYGVVWSIRMVCLLFLEFILNRLERGDSPVARMLGFLFAALLTTAPVFSGHAAAGEGLWLAIQLVAGATHLFFASLWLGGLVLFAWLLFWLAGTDRIWRDDMFKAATRRFSALGLISVVALAATGAYNAWTLVGAVPPLMGTNYGRLLLIKLALILPLIAVAAVNLLKLKPRILASAASRSIASAGDLMRRLGGNVSREALLGAAILAVVGMMSVTPPARHVQPEWPFAFRWFWSPTGPSAKIRAQIADAEWLAVAGIIGVACAFMLRRRPRYRLLVVGVAALGYGGWVYHSAIAIDAYPTTYLRPSVPYNVISVANGAYFYRETCATCHGVGGYGDGPNGKGFKPRPADLTAKHAADHTAGDLFWWLTNGVTREGVITPMPGFGASLTDEERWDMINFLRTLSAAEQARQMTALVEPDPWLVAPDFDYRTLGDESQTLKDHRGNRIVMLVLFSLPESSARLAELEKLSSEFQSKNVKIILVPKDLSDLRGLDGKVKSLAVISDGSRETFDAYMLYRRSFSEQGTQPDPPVPPHMEFLIDRQGYVRARWIPRDGPGWDKLEKLWRDIDRLNQEKPSAPAPDDHVH